MNTKKPSLLWRLILFIALNAMVFGLVNHIAQTAHQAQGSSVMTLSRLGSRGDEVKKIQQRLKDWGYYKGTVDGIFGAQTQAAVKSFQKKHGLTQDGIAGPKTLAAIGLPAGSSSSSAASTNAKDKELELLSRLVSAEAKGESYTGMVAVAAVVLNRVKHPSFPDTLSGVIYEKGAFSPVDNGEINKPAVQNAINACQDAMNGVDPSGGAIFFYNPQKTTNQWLRSRTVTAVIGNHTFAK